MKGLSDDLKSSLTAAKLKALCILNDLSTSGNKSDLISRLLDSGLSRTELGLSEATSTGVKQTSDVDEEVIQPSLSLEDEDTLTPDVEPKIASSTVVENEVAPAEEILDAEVLDAEFVSLEEEVKAPKLPASKGEVAHSTSDAMTLLDMLKQPKIAAVFVVVLIIGAGTWYYFNNQLEPFTADTLRYGDEMTYTISEAEFSATDEFLDIVLDQLDTDQDLCKLAISDSRGIGTLKVTKGDANELYSQSSTDRLGAVNVNDGMGLNWLTVESRASYDFSNMDDITLAYSYPIKIGALESCEVAGTLKPKVEISSKKWNELKSQNAIKNEVSWNADAIIDGDFKQYEGTLTNYGVGGILGDLDTLSPGFSMLLQPVELQELLANDYIDDGASGSRLGWDWRVLGTETLGSTDMWTVSYTHLRAHETS